MKKVIQLGVSVCVCLSMSIGIGIGLSNLYAQNLPDFTSLVDKYSSAVVNISTSEKAKPVAKNAQPFENGDLEDLLRRFGFPVPPRQQQAPPPEPQEDGGSSVPRGVGSGFVFSADGYLITNAHVIEGADQILVTLSDKRELKAKVIGTDERSDVALLKVDAKNLPVIPFGDSSKIRVGEWVIAIGSPFGLENTVTAGIISTKARDTGDNVPLIQTDVAVNPGNSGGPLINLRGEVIGINSQIYSRTGAYVGISFAIPINEVHRIVEQLKANGKVIRGYIGVSLGMVTKEVADSLGLSSASGAVVLKVEPKTPAEKAGIKVGDIILNINGTKVDNPGDVRRLVGEVLPDKTLNVKVWRKGKTVDVLITVAEFPNKSDKADKNDTPATPKAIGNWLGVEVDDLSVAQKRDWKIDHGVVVKRVAAPANLQIKVGDVILSLGQDEVLDAKHFAELVAKLDPKRLLPLLVLRDGNAQYLVVRPKEKNANKSAE